MTTAATKIVCRCWCPGASQPDISLTVEPRQRAGHDTLSKQEKSRLSAGPSCSRLRQLRTSGRPADPGWASGPDGTCHAAGVQGSSRHPAAGRASERGATEAPAGWFQGNAGSAAIIAWLLLVATVAAREPVAKLPMYSPLSRT